MHRVRPQAALADLFRAWHRQAEVLRLVRASLPSTIEIVEELESDDLVLADPTQIHQIIMNLLTNAAQALSGTEVQRLVDSLGWEGPSARRADAMVRLALDLGLRRGEIAGRVLDPAGEPLFGVRVVARREGDLDNLVNASR